MDLLDGLRDLAPEMLWLDALVTTHPVSLHLSLLSEVMAATRRTNPHRAVELGLVSDLGVEPSKWSSLLADLPAATRERAFPHGFREGMLCYPEFPGRNLIEDLSVDMHADGFAWIRGALLRVADRHSRHCAYLNVLTFRCAVEGGRLHIAKDAFEALTADVLTYPNGTENQRKRVEALARAQLNGTYGLDGPHLWPKHFWTTNVSLPCRRGAAAS